ncbi:unnamed protein product [Heligmosomoides polygyrus]|uniref:DUF1534 domain-containing protein n=1 Tax=Heligmosomoides polygyrus TaxID=6339 RepID=A0A183FXE3_HELPZ|nr:unnamed protein product [Heligmosomoides polygyrus]
MSDEATLSADRRHSMEPGHLIVIQRATLNRRDAFREGRRAAITFSRRTTMLIRPSVGLGFDRRQEIRRCRLVAFRRCISNSFFSISAVVALTPPSFGVRPSSPLISCFPRKTPIYSHRSADTLRMMRSISAAGVVSLLRVRHKFLHWPF